jgi:signal transduction protein with GAF and PtsI domain
MQQKLRESEAIQSKINWNNVGAARFNEILKSDTTDIRILGDNVLKLLVGYLQANQAVFYVVNHEQQYLERIATYAYGKKKFVDDKINIHEGLAGQCIAEGETIYLKEIPRDYVKITSGLGEATPRNVLIVPLKTRDEINGVLEIASFKIFEEYEIRFIENMAESIASILSGYETSNQTKRLLEESQKRSHELAQQEEEMRQNAEELQATQEEMERQRTEMQREITTLKEKLKQFEHPASSVFQ